MINNTTKEKSILEIQDSYNVFKGTLINGVKKIKDYNFLSGIGGSNAGIYEIKINSLNSCNYYLLIKYVSYEKNLSFKVSINDIEDNKIYYTDFLSQWSINNPLTITIPAILNSGDNIIKIYGNEANKAPYIGDILLVLPPLTNDLSKGILENNAYIDTNTNFINAIGGPNDGSVIIAVRVNNTGLYNLSLKYSCSIKEKTLKISVNELDSKEFYRLPLTNGLNENNLGTFTILINLNKGINTIKFHGDEINYGPSITSFSISEFNKIETSIFSASKVYKISSGTLGGGAFFDKNNNVVTKLGGVNDGYSIVNIPIDIFGDYLIKLNYINNKALKIDINGIETETIYNIVGNKIGVFSVTIPLVVGINQLKFHGDGKNNAPDLRDFTLELSKDKSSLAFLGATSKGAKITSVGRVENLGGINDGKYSFEYVAEVFGEYIIYLTLDTSKAINLSIDINKNTHVKYKFSKNDVATVYMIAMFLEKGSNSITFHGDHTNKAPNILNIEVKLSLPIKDSIYYFTDGFLEGGAVKDISKSFIEGLGGIENGAVTIKVNINNSDLYDLDINYIGQSIDIPLKIDINSISTNTIYILPKKNLEDNLKLQSFKITISLVKGLNNIKFFGNGINTIPKFSHVKITKALIKDSKPFSGTYTLMKGANGAEADNSRPNFFKGIGGIRKGVAVLFVEVPRTGEYILEVEYLKINDNEKIIIELGANSGTNDIYNPPKTKSLKVEDSKTFTVPVVLSDKMILCFYGNGVDNSPLIGKITATEVKVPTPNNPCKITSIELYNGAKKYKGEDFITSIGGKENGTLVLKIDTLDLGIYDLGFKYISGFYEKILNVDINSNEYSSSYRLPATNSLNLINAQTCTIPLLLKERSNTIKLEGNGDDFAPVIGKFKIIANNNKSKVIYDTATGVLKNGAKVNSYGLVTNIGGPKQGEVTVKVLIYNNDVYNLALEYKLIEKNQLLELVVNEVKYILECTTELNKWSLVDMPILNKRIYLDSGYSTLTFKGVENNYAPFLGKFTLTKASNLYSFTQTLPKGSYDVKKGKLENGANIIGAYVNNIGGILKGAVTIKVNVEADGIYSMIIEYMAEEYSVLLFDINGEQTGEVYPFNATNDCNSSDIEEIEVILNKGENLIKFYGVKDLLSPNLSIISFNLVNS